jgi:hypothetical protein
MKCKWRVIVQRSFRLVDRLVGQCGREFQHQGCECGVAPQQLELRQVLLGTLAALASELKPVILVNLRSALGLDEEKTRNGI